jgi:hypothetical protein
MQPLPGSKNHYRAVLRKVLEHKRCINKFFYLVNPTVIGHCTNRPNTALPGLQSGLFSITGLFYRVLIAPIRRLRHISAFSISVSPNPKSISPRALAPGDYRTNKCFRQIPCRNINYKFSVIIANPLSNFMTFQRKVKEAVTAHYHTKCS